MPCPDSPARRFPYVNGVAMANPDKVTICLGSDGSQMEGNDAEAARLAVAQQLNIKVAGERLCSTRCTSAKSLPNYSLSTQSIQSY